MTTTPDTAPQVWDDSVQPGGYVCAVATPDGTQCGMPVESEPCPTHDHPVTTTATPTADEIATLAELVNARINAFRRAEVAHDNPEDTVDEITHLNEILTKLAGLDEHAPARLS
jgi:hypothetical protein